MTPKQAKPVVVEETLGEKLERWYDQNGKWINVLLIVVLAGVIGYKAYDWINARGVAKANLAYSVALDHYQTASRTPDVAAKLDEYQGAITAAEQVVAEHGDQFVGRQAQLMIGNAQYAIATAQSGQSDAVSQLEKARDSYEKYIAMAHNNREKAAGHLALGNVLENLSFIRSDKGVLQQAADAYTQALSAGEGTYLGAEARMAIARTKTAINSAEAHAEAIKLYQEVAKNRDAQLVSTEELETAEAIKMESGQTISKEEVVDLKNLAAWSQQKVAQDALTRLK